MAKVFLPHHTMEEARRLFDRFLARFERHKCKIQFARAQAEENVAIEEALASAFTLLTIESARNKSK